MVQLQWTMTQLFLFYKNNFILGRVKAAQGSIWPY
jgi:hypothetical protein